MSNLFRPQSAAAATCWLDTQRAFESIPEGPTPGVVAKDLPSGRYWYRQEPRPAGGRAQVYLGSAKDPAVLMEVSRLRARQEASRHASRMARAAKALGCAAVAPQHGRVIQAVAACGFFRTGGVIGGTHAFLAYQNHLGVLWGATETTMDLDFVVPRSKTVLMREHASAMVNVHKAIEHLGMGFVERSEQGGFVKGDEPSFEIDLLTTISRAAPAGADPISIKGFEGRYLPLKFMELAFHEPLDLWVMISDRLVKVRVPDPGDFAMHKLIVAFERKDKQPTKAAKDLMQAGCLMAVLHEQSPSLLETAYLGVLRRGKGWRQRVELSLDRLVERLPELAYCVQSLREATSDGASEDLAPTRVPRPRG